MPLRMTDKEKVSIFNRIMQIHTNEGISLKFCCIRFGLPPTSFPNFKKTITRIITRSPELKYQIDKEFREGVDPNG